MGLDSIVAVSDILMQLLLLAVLEIVVGSGVAAMLVENGIHCNNCVITYRGRLFDAEWPKFTPFFPIK